MPTRRTWSLETRPALRSSSPFGVDPVPGWHLDVPVAAGSADDHLPHRDVVRGGRLVQVMPGVGRHLDVVRAVGQFGDVERLARDRLDVGVTPGANQVDAYQPLMGTPGRPSRVRPPNAAGTAS